MRGNTRRKGRFVCFAPREFSAPLNVVYAVADRGGLHDHRTDDRGHAAPVQLAGLRLFWRAAAILSVIDLRRPKPSRAARVWRPRRCSSGTSFGGRLYLAGRLHRLGRRVHGDRLPAACTCSRRATSRTRGGACGCWAPCWRWVAVNLAVGARQFAAGDSFMLFWFVRSKQYLGRASGSLHLPGPSGRVSGGRRVSEPVDGPVEPGARLGPAVLFGYGALMCFAGLIITVSRGGIPQFLRGADRDDGPEPGAGEGEPRRTTSGACGADPWWSCSGWRLAGWGAIHAAAQRVDRATRALHHRHPAR